MLSFQQSCPHSIFQRKLTLISRSSASLSKYIRLQSFVWLIFPYSSTLASPSIKRHWSHSFSSSWPYIYRKQLISNKEGNIVCLKSPDIQKPKLKLLKGLFAKYRHRNNFTPFLIFISLNSNANVVLLNIKTITNTHNIQVIQIRKIPSLHKLVTVYKHPQINHSYQLPLHENQYILQYNDN